MTTPRAILVGLVLAGALVGAGLYFGLRQAPPAAPAAAAPAGGAAAPAGGAAASPFAPVPRDAVARQAVAALEPHRGAVAKACLPAGATGRAEFLLNVTFDAAGRQMARGIQEQRGTAATGLGGCVNDRTPALTVPAPGAVVMVEVPFSLP